MQLRGNIAMDPVIEMILCEVEERSRAVVICMGKTGNFDLTWEKGHVSKIVYRIQTVIKYNIS